MIKLTKVVTAALAVISFATVATEAHASTYTQKSYALSPYKASKWKTVSNTNYYMKRPGTYIQSWTASVFQTSPTYLTHKGGNQNASFKSNVFLPVTRNTSGDWGNPQSLVLTPGGSSAYIMYTNKGGSNTGWVAHYNLAKLRSVYGVSTNSMDILRRASYALSIGKATSSYQAVLKCIKFSSKYTTGHGQSLALNPKNNQLWFVKSPGTSGGTATVQQLSKTTLKPSKTIKFRLRSSDGHKVTMGQNLTFDKKGYAYFSSQVSGTRALKIYKGTISAKKVKFSLVMQGLKNKPGQLNQSVGYNPKSNRLYFVSDNSISSVPVSKLGKLKASDVKASTFNGNREFENIAFTSNGSAYLLTNKSAEIMKGSGIK